MEAPEGRSSAWANVASTAAKFKDMGLALRAIYEIDAVVDDRNLAPRSTWPSTLMYKQIFYRAAKSLAEDAELLLEKIPTPAFR